MPLIITRETKGSLLTPAQGDDQIAFSTRYLSGALTLSSTHNRETLECNGTFAITLPDAATLQTSLHESANYGDIGFRVTVVNIGSGAITVDLTTAADTLRGVANGTLVLAPEQSVTLTLNSNGATADGYFQSGGNFEGAVFVSNSNGNPNFSDTVIAVHSATVDTWESFGPTGSGADNIEAVLDAIPLGVSWIEVRTLIFGTWTSAGASLNLHCRATGSVEGKNNDNRVAGFNNVFSGAETRSYNQLESGVKVPVDATNSFDWHWTKSGTTTTSINIHLFITGYGWN